MDKNSIKKKITNAGIFIFLQKGIDNSTLEDIANYAQIQQNEIKKYFNTKDEIFEHIVDDFFEKVLKKFEPVHVFDDLDLFFNSIYEAAYLNEEEAGIYSLYLEYSNYLNITEEHRNNMLLIFESLTEVLSLQLEHLQKIQSVKTDLDIRLTARSLVGVLNGFTLHRCIFRLNSKTYQDILKETLQNIKKGIQY